MNLAKPVLQITEEMDIINNKIEESQKEIRKLKLQYMFLEMELQKD